MLTFREEIFLTELRESHVFLLMLCSVGFASAFGFALYAACDGPAFFFVLAAITLALALGIWLHSLRLLRRIRALEEFL